MRKLGFVMLALMGFVNGYSQDMKVDFSYAFALPHRLTVALPNSSDKTLLDVNEQYLRMAWTYENLLDKPLGAFLTPRTNWEVHIKPERDGQPFKNSRWRRLDGWLPMLENVYLDSVAQIKLEVVGGARAAMVRIEVENRDDHAHDLVVRCERPKNITGYNPAWVQPEWDNDVLLAGWQERADRIIVFGLGGDEKPVIGANTLSMVWHMAAKSKQTGWLIRPYRSYHPTLAALRNIDWSQEYEQAKQIWRQLMQQASAIHIPDQGVENAFYAGLADCFIMREPISAEYVAGCPGTEGYRAPGSGEPAIVAVLLDQMGMHTESALGFQFCLDEQGADGNWSDPLGWGHYWWGCSGFKSFSIMEHFRLTGDRKYLEALYPRMLASSRWQEQQRARTRILNNNERPLTYGLFPRGMGDCGLKDDEDLYGVFLPHNIWAVYADAMTLQAATILGKNADLAELQAIYNAGWTDLQQAMDKGAIVENGYRWIPGVAGKTCGSRWGALNAAFPCRLLAPDHELIAGTIRKIESWKSPGGIPVNTGWLKDGMWVAITLDNLAEVQLLRDEGDAASAYLYATLNHGTPLYSWCEERGQEAGSKQITGDRQHLWTPLAVCRYLRDALVMEDGDALHLARGTARQWLGGDQPLSCENMKTHFGSIAYELRYIAKSRTITGFVRLQENRTIPQLLLHLRLPNGLKPQKIQTTANGQLQSERSVIAWENFSGTARFSVVCK